jgi:phage tail sheath protein FI
MATDFLHGTEVLEITDGIRPISTVKSSVIGLVGTAPDADAATFPLNTPVLLYGEQRLAAKLDTTGDGEGTLKDAIDAIFDQTGAVVVLVRVEEGATDAETLSNILGDSTLMTGVWALLTAQTEVKVTPRILIAPGFTGVRPSGVSTIAVDTAGTGYSDATTTVTITGDGEGAEATATIVDGAITAITVTKKGFGYTAAPAVTVTDTGDGAGATATATIASVANPVVAELQGIAERMRSVIIADGPNSTNTAAITYREDWGSDRIYIVDPHVSVWDTDLDAAVAQPASGRVAGLIAKIDNQHGFWWSPSNKVINGIVGVARPIDFALSDSNCAANYLNENEVTTIIQADGYRLWGNRTTSADPQWAFLSVRRTADMIEESIEQGYLWANDRPMSVQLFADIIGGVEAYLRTLKSRGAILGGKVWFDQELNSETVLKAGQAFIDFDIEPPAPLERLTFRVHRNDGYYTELVAEVAELTSTEAAS